MLDKWHKLLIHCYWLIFTELIDWFIVKCQHSSQLLQRQSLKSFSFLEFNTDKVWGFTVYVQLCYLFVIVLFVYFVTQQPHSPAICRKMSLQQTVKHTTSCVPCTFSWGMWFFAHRCEQQQIEYLCWTGNCHRYGHLFFTLFPLQIPVQVWRQYRPW